MRILFLTSAHNGLSQRAFLELTELGHTVAIGLADSDRAMHEAVDRHRPELIVAPMLKRAIPEAIWRRHVCIVVHPGPRGDRGPSSLDWAILEGAERWGVTLLQAAAEMDAGPIWASREFPMRAASKSSIYGHEVTDAAMRALREAVGRFERRKFRPEPLDYGRPDVFGRLRPRMTQEDRRIDWSEPTASVLRKLRSADGSPGVRDRIGDLEVSLFVGHEEEQLRGRPGALLATRDGAICRATGDGAVWIPSLKLRTNDERFHCKLPAALALGPARLAGVPDLALPPDALWAGRTYRQIRYHERGAVGYLHFEFPNGAMSTAQCRRLRAAVRAARARPTGVLVLLGGPDYWSNGIHLNVIEAAASPADESWRNINAIDDLVGEIVTIEDKLVVAALEGNAGAGGVTLAAAADRVWARPSVVLNPHYKSMGGFYGSEYWTYLLPRRVGRARTLELTEGLLPIGAGAARAIGLVDDVFGPSPASFHARVTELAEALARGRRHAALLGQKRERRERDERRKPLQAYRTEELARMLQNFYGPDPAYHDARHRFVYKLGPDAPRRELASCDTGAGAPQGARPAPNGQPGRGAEVA